MASSNATEDTWKNPSYLNHIELSHYPPADQAQNPSPVMWEAGFNGKQQKMESNVQPWKKMENNVQNKH